MPGHITIKGTPGNWTIIVDSRDYPAETFTSDAESGQELVEVYTDRYPFHLVHFQPTV